MKAYYSEKQRTELRSMNWRLSEYVLKDGKTVVVTDVRGTSPSWDDSVELGDVDHWVRNVPA